MDIEVLNATTISRPSLPMREAANNPGVLPCARTTCRPRRSAGVLLAQLREAGDLRVQRMLRG